jgi:hypothetical protein
MAFYTTALRRTIETPAAKTHACIVDRPTCVAAAPDQETIRRMGQKLEKSAALLPRIVSAFEFVSQMKS